MFLSQCGPSARPFERLVDLRRRGLALASAPSSRRGRTRAARRRRSTGRRPRRRRSGGRRPGSSSRSSQTSPARQPSSAGTPLRSRPRRRPRTSRASGSFEAKRAAISSWSCARKWTPNRRECSTAAERPGRAVEADDHQRRLERQRGDGVRGHAGRAVGAEAGDDADAGREAAAGVAERGRVDAGRGMAAASSIESGGERLSGAGPFAAVIRDARPRILVAVRPRQPEPRAVLPGRRRTLVSSPSARRFPPVERPDGRRHLMMPPRESRPRGTPPRCRAHRRSPPSASRAAPRACR